MGDSMINGYEVVSTYSGIKADALAILVFEDEGLPEEFHDLDQVLGGELSELLKEKDFKGELGKAAVLYALRTSFKRLIVVGGGKSGEADAEVLRSYGGLAVQKARDLGLSKLYITLREVKGLNSSSSLRAVAEGAELANYVWGAKKDVKRVDEIFVAGKVEVPDSENI
jgi:leucyl aminopeptidase